MKYEYFWIQYFFIFIGNQQKNKSSSQVPPDTPELTEAELRFMSEQMGDTDSECKFKPFVAKNYYDEHIIFE